MPLFTLRPLLLGLVLLVAGIAHAQTAPDAAERVEIERLHRAGHSAAALERIERGLQADPREPQLRFLKGVILADTGRRAEAAEIYTRLTQEYPELPEPYNNLAVLHAADGRLDEARAALENALRNDPTYATAHENLGDIYLRLAVRAFERSDRRSPDVQRKLQLARELVQARPAAAPRS